MPEKTPRDPQPAPHDLILESRARLTVTGVQTLEYTVSAPAGGFLRRLLR